MTTTKELEVSISRGNTKMGAIPSVSLPVIITCRKCGCNGLCYAAKGHFAFDTVKNAFDRNLHIFNTDPEKYWKAIDDEMSISKFFRFHVSGDIPSTKYLDGMVAVTKKNPTTDVIVFTKKYELVNKWIDVNGPLPTNMHMLFSKWTDLEMPNPHNLPESHVLFRDGTSTADPKRSIPCGGHCLTCARAHTGCFGAKAGDQIVLIEH